VAEEGETPEFCCATVLLNGLLAEYGVQFGGMVRERVQPEPATERGCIWETGAVVAGAVVARGLGVVVALIVCACREAPRVVKAKARATRVEVVTSRI